MNFFICSKIHSSFEEHDLVYSRKGECCLLIDEALGQATLHIKTKKSKIFFDEDELNQTIIHQVKFTMLINF
jgi:hypothetical protein